MTSSSDADIRAWCAACGAEDQISDLIAASRNADSMYIEWRRLQRGGLRRLQESRVPLYEGTRLFRTYSSQVVPGLLQTPEYAAALLSAMALPSVSLGIVPFTVSARPQWVLEGFTMFDDRRVHGELLGAQVTVTTPGEVDQYVRAHARLRALAAHGEQARRLISPAPYRPWHGPLRAGGERDGDTGGTARVVAHGAPHVYDSPATGKDTGMSSTTTVAPRSGRELVTNDEFAAVSATVLDHNAGMTQATAERIVSQALAFVATAATTELPLPRPARSTRAGMP